MAVKIRLRRMGRKKAPHYRIVVADSTAPRDGRFVESVGYYKPLETPARLVVDLERVDYWMGQGAAPSDTVKSLVEKARKGGDAKVAVGEVDPEAARKEKADAAEARRKAEAEAKAKAEAEAKAAAAAEAEAKAAAEAAAATEAEAAAEAAAPSDDGEAEAAAEGEAETKDA